VPTNIEVKARIENPQQTVATLRAIGAQPIEQSTQEDIFFSVPRGRLKVRSDNAGLCELVYYRRPNQTGPAISSYYRRHLNDAALKKEELRTLFGISNVVRKKRAVFLRRGARINVDQVDGLGSFLEIEVPLDQKRNANRAMVVVRELMGKLCLQDHDLVPEAYEDLLCKKK